MDQVYFPSCNFTAASPEASKRIKGYLSSSMDIAGCCWRVDNSKHVGKKAFYICQACRGSLESEERGGFETENLFVYLDADPAFAWPDYSGLTVTIQDCWRDKGHPEIFDAVRSCLHKMKITVVEMEENREKSTYCGDIHTEPQKPENQALLAQNPGKAPREISPEAVGALSLEQTEKYPCSLVVCYCNSCIRGMKAAKKAGWQGESVHLLELATGTFQRD